MASIKNLQELLNQPLPVDVPKREVVITELVIVPKEEEETFYLYPYKSKFEAAKALNEFYESVQLPDIIAFKCSKIKKDFITKSFELVKKYWKDDNYVRSRLMDLDTVKKYI